MDRLSPRRHDRRALRRASPGPGHRAAGRHRLGRGASRREPTGHGSVPLWRDQCLVAGDPPSSALRLKVAAVDGADQHRLVLLGLANGTPEFAVDLSDLAWRKRSPARARTPHPTSGRYSRTCQRLRPEHRPTLAACCTGVRHQRYCGRCGSAALPRDAGHLRACTSAECGTLLFPHLEPAIIQS